MAFGIDEFILQGMFHAGEFRHPHLEAMRFQEQAAQHVGQMGAQRPAVNGMPPELIDIVFDAIQILRQFGLAAGHQRNIFGVMLQGEHDRFIGGDVAGMQRRDDIDRSHFRFGDFAMRKTHAVEMAFLGNSFGGGDQGFARFHGNDFAAPAGTEIQIV